MARLRSVGQSLELLVRSDLSRSARQQLIADAARKGLTEAQAQNRRVLGRVPPHEQFVDGRAGAPLQSVDPDQGRIAFVFTLLDDLLGWVDLQLIKHSPVLTGAYRRGHVLLADGEPVDPSADVLPQAREYVYVNTLPYARKIERGQSDQAPEGVYEVVATLAAGRFGNLASVKFSYRSLTGGAVGAWAAGTSLTRPGRRMADHARQDWLTRQPAIVIVPR